MGSLRFYAISIEEVRDIFHASEETATALRTVAEQRFGQPVKPSSGLLGKLGPVFRRPPDAPVIRPDIPSGSDIDALLSGRFVPPHRLGACWVLLETWIDALAWGSMGKDCSEAQLNDFDFALVRAEVPARHGVRSILRTDLGIPILPGPGLAAGWATGEHARQMSESWTAARDRLSGPDREFADSILALLDQFPSWVEEAPGRNRPYPDLLAILHA